MSKLDDIKFMTMAIELAKKGNYRTHPNPLVGLLCKRQQNISKDFTEDSEVNMLKEKPLIN